MLLKALNDLYDRLAEDPSYGIAPPGYSYQKVSFVVVLNENGTLFEIQDNTIKEGTRSVPAPVLVPGGTKKTGSGLNPCFLWDKMSYLLGYDTSNPTRARKAFEAYRKRHLSVESEIDLQQFSAVCRFLERWEPSEARNHPVLDELKTGFGVFQIRGQAQFVHDHPKIREWWLAQEIPAARKGLTGTCAVTGRNAPIAKLHEPKIKGVAGTQSTGAVIVGFNWPACESYGKSQSYNAPVAEEVARRYTTAMNALLSGPMRHKHRLVVAGTTVAFWTDAPVPAEDVFLQFLDIGSKIADSQDQLLRAKLEAFLRALKQGRLAYSEMGDRAEHTGYCMVGFAPNAARISIRFFHRDTLAGLLDNLRRHFSDINVERRWGSGSANPDAEFPPVRLLLRQTARTESDIPPVLAGALLSSIITGSRYPEALYQAVLRRIAAERMINYARACIIKGYLTRNLRKEVPVSLDCDRTDPAYRLGRLFAVLEKTQADALGAVNASVRDRFYSSASSTPASVFPRLLRTYQHHLAKLDPGRKINREKLAQEILDSLTEFPAHIGLAEQGLFALGYYHQMNDFYRPTKAVAENDPSD